MADDNRQHVVVRQVTTVRQRRIVSSAQDYSDLKEHFLSLMEEIRADRSVGIKLLVGTGMYTEDGQLKDEFR